MKKTIKKIILEMIPVILGIVIALFINNWSKQKEDKKYVAEIMVLIKKELAENKETLERNINNHRMILDTLDFYTDNEAYNLGSIISKSKGLKLAYIKNTAWKSFLNYNYSLVKYDVISNLTNIDEEKEAYYFQKGKLYDYLIDNIEDKDYISKEKFKIILQTLLELEESILNSHSELLE